ncbi:unnamed protein product [Anisakis simplex]|uniref:SUN domain-containing protein n=1 Tax=Anisakis simplex TaxID=6269 RepID=A0A0M3K7Y0_ANISI|nr:unnamed protein product [Anisakis simplex]
MEACGSSLTDLLDKRRRSAAYLVHPRSNTVTRYSVPNSKRHNPKFSLLDDEHFLPRGASNGSLKSTTKSQIITSLSETRFQKFCHYLQYIYKKSHIHSFFPVLILIAYSFLGGLIFYTIECPNEEELLLEKKAYIDAEKRTLFSIIADVEHNVQLIRATHNTTSAINAQLRQYNKFALNVLNKAAYWYALSVYYLTDHESYKASVLHPESPEKLWQNQFATNFGRIHALRNYTEQVGGFCDRE